MELVFNHGITQSSCKISSFPGTIGPIQLAHVRHGVNYQIMHLKATKILVLWTTKAISIVRINLVDMENLKAHQFIITTIRKFGDISGRTMPTVFTNSIYSLWTAQLMRLLSVKRLIKWANNMAKQVV